MRGTVRKISTPRRVVIDLMRASADVPFVAVRRALNVERLATARRALETRPAWAVIFAKGFAVLAGEQPLLRTAFLKWPWSRFFEYPQTTAMIVVVPDAAPDGVLLFPIRAPDLVALGEADGWLRKAKSAPIDATPFFRRTHIIARLPLPLRRLAWAIGLNTGRHRAKHFGTLLITSVAAFGGGEVEALAPGPFILSYDKVAADGSIDVMVRWDHRITDAAVIGTALSRLEQILNGQIADELRALGPVEQVTADPALPERIDSRLVGRIPR
jgi:hypothetical protein